MKNSSDNILKDFFLNKNHRLMHKWMHYFEIYDRYFNQYRGKDVNLLEIGVSHGGSLQMWKNYFGIGAKIFGADNDLRCSSLSENGISISYVDQENRDSLIALKNKTPKMDIIIDDGGHSMNQQILTFEELYPHVKYGGIYIVEDMHTSYWPSFGGGYLKETTFLEYCKHLIDKLNAWHSFESELTPDDFTKSTYSLHFYDSVMVIEKKHIDKPISVMKGIPSFPLTDGERKALENSKLV